MCAKHLRSVLWPLLIDISRLQRGQNLSTEDLGKCGQLFLTVSCVRSQCSSS